MDVTETPEGGRGYQLAMELIDAGGPDAAQRLRAALGKHKGSMKSESMIEATLFVSIIGYLAVFSDLDVEAPREQFIFGETVAPENVGVWQQALVGGYRVDFLITWRSAAGVQFVVVECDGHEFHERTKEQAARDRSRDRKIQAVGVPVLRFTGSEIWARANGCAKEVVEFLIYRKAAP